MIFGILCWSLTIFVELLWSSMIFCNFQQYLAIFGNFQPLLKSLKINWNGLKLLELSGGNNWNRLKFMELDWYSKTRIEIIVFDMSIGGWQFGSGITRFPGLFLKQLKGIGCYAGPLLALEGGFSLWPWFPPFMQTKAFVCVFFVVVIFRLFFGIK